MEKITLLSTSGAYVTFDSKGGEFIKSTGLPANYETYDGSGVTANGAYYLIRFNGANVSINPYTTEGYQQHGATLQNVFLGTREITLKVLVAVGTTGYHANTNKFFYDIRKQIFDLANPLNGELTIMYENSYSVKQIKAILKEMPTEAENHGAGRVYNIALIANEPFWTDIEPATVTLKRATGGLQFPFKFDSSNIHFGTISSAQSLYYAGEAPAGVKIVITADNTCVNPIITCVNSDGTQYVGLNKTLSADETFTITTHYGEKKVYYNGTNAMRYLLSGSSFFSIEPGVNTFSISAMSGSAKFTVEYNTYYVNP